MNFNYSERPLHKKTVVEKLTDDLDSLKQQRREIAQESKDPDIYLEKNSTRYDEMDRQLDENIKNTEITSGQLDLEAALNRTNPENPFEN